MTKKSEQDQIIATFNGGYVLPGAKSNLSLAGGKNGAHYSLSSQCNLPYVTLAGSKGYQKTISWGEVAEVPCGQLVTVINDSAHAGNLIINAGKDPCPLPARITVPVRIVSTGAEFGTSQTAYAFDTRRAKRAYLFIVAAGAIVATVVGRSRYNMPTVNTITAPNVGTGYQFAQNYSVAFPQIPPIPLGFLAFQGDDTRPMALLDSALVAFDVGFGADPAAFYVGEYL